jgi:RNA polymerase sigma-70 factor (ECF subfamily)
MLCSGAAAGLLGVSMNLADQLEEAMQRGYVAAYRLLGNPDESRDACQEAAARALSAQHRYDPTRPFYPWFYRILRNHCIDRLKQRKRMVPTPDEPASGAAPSHGDRSAESLAVLPDDLREIIELRHFQDATYEEIADILSCPVGTVMSRLYRARKALRSKLKADRAWGPSSGAGGSQP